MKPKKCQECQQVARLYGHHNDYHKPLEVEWLCQPCHEKRHKALKMVELMRNSESTE